MTTITHKGREAKINANIGEYISAGQAKRALKLLGKTGEFWFTGDNGVQIYKHYNGPWMLRQLSPEQIAAGVVK